MFIHNFDPVLFDFYIFQLRWYSLAYFVGIIAGWIYAKKIINYVKNGDNLNHLKTKTHLLNY